MAGCDELLRTCGNERDTVFVCFDFFWNADFHGVSNSSDVSGKAEHLKVTSAKLVFNEGFVAGRWLPVMGRSWIVVGEFGFAGAGRRHSLFTNHQTPATTNYHFTAPARDPD
jgi:hypothetical protein